MNNESDDSIFLEEQGSGPSVPDAREPANPMIPENLPPVEPAPAVDYAARFSAEIHYLRERVEESQNALAASQRTMRRGFVLGLLLIVILGASLFQITRQQAADLARVKTAAASVVAPPPAGHSFAEATVTFFHWSQGDPPIRLIRRNEGVCFLTQVSGHFEGGGEFVKVWIDPDGYWYLGGQSNQQGVNADCAVLKW